jgi:hypothetical protein
MTVTGPLEKRARIAFHALAQAIRQKGTNALIQNA